MKQFLISIDTEGDNLWARPRVNTTRNSAFLPRFQALCERFGFKPTYLTNHEMAGCPVFQEFAHDALRRGTCEVGMHLHAWDSPPIVPLTDDDSAHHPYLMEFPEHLMREKVAALTARLEDTFGRKMVSHRAGRWGFNEAYARVLVDHGYLVDCSVTPLLSWAGSRGAPEGRGGPDYTHFPDGAYFVDLDDVSRPGDSPLLELPLSVIAPRSAAVRSLHRRFRGGPRLVRGALYRVAPPTRKLVPNGHNLRHLLQIVRRAVEDGRDYVQFTLHSSEFMPGGSPRFRDGPEIERLYRHLESLFSFASRWFKGASLHECYEGVAASRGGAVEAGAKASRWHAEPAGVGAA
jgi:hypothetical protein